MSQPKEVPDYLALGHISKDLTAGGSVAPGGTALYAALTAQRLGLQAALLTACAPQDRALLDPLREAGVWIKVEPSLTTTAFRNVYDKEENRVQTVASQARELELTEVPEAWRAAPIVHLGPIAHELPAEAVHSFTPALLGVTPQGWLRRWGERGRVQQVARPVPAALLNLPHNAVLVLSIEDLGYDAGLLYEYGRLAPLTVVTRGAGTALFYQHGEHRAVPACRAQAVDPTGAGDVFAAALFVRYLETADPIEAVRFAHAAAAYAVEAPGIAGIAGREAVERRLRRAGGSER